MRKKLSLAHFGITVGVPSSRQANAQIRIRAQALADAQFGVEIGWRHCQPQRQISAQKPGIIQVIKSVAWEWGMPLQGDVVAHLNQFAFDRIDLAKGDDRAEPAQQTN